jgi:hypothetical protein
VRRRGAGDSRLCPGRASWWRRIAQRPDYKFAPINLTKAECAQGKLDDAKQTFAAVEKETRLWKEIPSSRGCARRSCRIRSPGRCRRRDRHAASGARSVALYAPPLAAAAALTIMSLIADRRAIS